ncbi:MAG: prenyltransferase [Miltoncostaeaceae bacterium]
MRRIVGVYLEMRVVPVLLWSFTAITLGTALAAQAEGGFTIPGYLVAVIIGVLLQGFVAHTVNELADWRSGTDRDRAPRVISGGSKVIAAGLLTERELVVLGVTAGLAAAALGLAAAAIWSWALLLYGAVGLVGAVLYTLPPVRAAYRPLWGEGIAFVCVWACVSGAYLLQTDTLTGAVVLAGGAHAAFCVAMLMMHHYLDRGPDRRAMPPKTTTIVRLGERARAYALAWAVVALTLAAAAAVTVHPAFAIMAAAYLVALAPHVVPDLDSPGGVTRAEFAVIVLGIAGGLGTAAALTPSLAWVLAVPVVLVPLELRIAGWALAPLREAPLEPARGSTGG